MLVEIPLKIAVSWLMGLLKMEISHEKWRNLKYKYRGRELCCRGYYVDTVGKNTKAIAEYIKNQLKEDEMNQQLVLD